LDQNVSDRFLLNVSILKDSGFDKLFSERLLSAWNLFTKNLSDLFLAKPESYSMKSFRRNLSENIYSVKPESFRMENF
jgi:hypothetical protein